MSFRAEESIYACASYDHCCHLEGLVTGRYVCTCVCMHACMYVRMPRTTTAATSRALSPAGMCVRVYVCMHACMCVCLVRPLLPPRGSRHTGSVRTDRCDLRVPSWHCYDEGGAHWAPGQPVSTIAYKGSLASSTMADGGTILIHLAGDYGIHTHTHTHTSIMPMDGPPSSRRWR